MKEAVATDISEFLSNEQSEEVRQYLLAQQKMSSTAFRLFVSGIKEL